MWRVPALLAAGSLLVACTTGASGAGGVASTSPPSSSTRPAPSSTPPSAPTSSSRVSPSISVGPAPTTVPPTAVPAPVRDFSTVDAIVGDFVSERGIAGAGLVVVDRDAGIVHEAYWGEFDAERVSLIASSSKMITAGVLMKLDEDGLIDLDAPVAEAVDWGAGNPEITVAQLLSNSSGLVGLGPNPFYGPYICQFQPDRQLEECAAEAFSSPDDDADVVAPDTEFRYGGVQWQIAGAVAEAVTGRSWGELVDEIYVQPCEVHSLGYTNHWSSSNGFAYPVGFDPTEMPTDNPNMEGGAYITAPDYARLLLMHLRGGECPKGRVLSEASIEELHADRVLDTFGDTWPGGPGYGMGWWIDRATGRIADHGAYGSTPWLDVDDGYGAYLVVEENGEVGAALVSQLEPVIHEIMTGDG